MKQFKLLENQDSAYGGELFKTRKGRSTPRPLDTRNTMHLVLRSSKAKGEWSFRRTKNAAAIKTIIHKFANKYGVRILSLANVGNHLHMQVKLSNRFSYKSFIRAITSAIVMAVTGNSRWNKVSVLAKSDPGVVGRRSQKKDEKFWDYRPYSRVVKSLRAFLNLKDYIRINQMEGKGHKREDARTWIEREKAAKVKGRQSRHETG